MILVIVPADGNFPNYPARACASRRLSDLGWCSYIIYIYVCGREKNLNRTLEIDSPFQTFAVGLLIEVIDYRVLSKSRISI